MNKFHEIVETVRVKERKWNWLQIHFASAVFQSEQSETVVPNNELNSEGERKETGRINRTQEALNRSFCFE